jgi:hypothetical protein
MQLVAQRGGADVRASVACACENQGVRERARAEAGAEAAAWHAPERMQEDCRADARAMHVPMCAMRETLLCDARLMQDGRSFDARLMQD